MDLRRLALLVGGLVLVAGCTSPTEVTKPHPLAGKGDACPKGNYLCVLPADATRPFDASQLGFEHVIVAFGEPDHLQMEGEWVVWHEEEDYLNRAQGISHVVAYHLPTRQLFVVAEASGDGLQSSGGYVFYQHQEVLEESVGSQSYLVEYRAWKAGTGNVTWTHFGLPANWTAATLSAHDGIAAAHFAEPWNATHVTPKGAFILDLEREASARVPSDWAGSVEAVDGASVYLAGPRQDGWGLHRVGLEGFPTENLDIEIIPRAGQVWSAGDRLYVETFEPPQAVVLKPGDVAGPFNVPEPLTWGSRYTGRDPAGISGPWMYSWEGARRGLWAYDIEQGRAVNVTLPLAHGTTGNGVYDLAGVAADGDVEVLALQWGRFASSSGDAWCICINDGGPRLLPT